MQRSFKNLQLTKQEFALYETLLKSGPLPIVSIAKQSAVNRSYCYELLEKLSVKGFVSKILINNKIHWQALSRTKILYALDSYREKLNTYLENIEQKYKPETPRSIALFKGTKGVRSLLEDITVSKTKVVGFGIKGKLKQFFPYYYPHFADKIKQSDIPFELIFLKKGKPIPTAKTKYKSFPEALDSSVEINVYEDKTILIFWKDPVEAIEIVDKDVANSFRNFHKLFWDQLK